MNGTFALIFFLGAWAAIAIVAIRKKKSKTIAVGGGFVAACTALVALAYGYDAISGKGAPSDGASDSSASEASAAEYSNDELVDQIWATYKSLPGNQGSGGILRTKEVQVHGQLVKRGTVPPTAMNSSVSGRLPAYMACYDYIAVMTSSYGTSDSKADLCIYMIRNPITETSSLMWRGKEYLQELQSKMAEDGFVGE